MEGGGLSVTSPFGVGLGQQFPFIGDNPGAGVLFTRTFDGNFARRILSLVFTVTAANAGSSRFVAVEYRGKDALPFAGGFPGSLLAINTANRYWGSVSRTVSDFATGTDVGFPLDDVILSPAISSLSTSRRWTRGRDHEHTRRRGTLLLRSAPPAGSVAGIGDGRHTDFQRQEGGGTVHLRATAVGGVHPQGRERRL
jgi:hypothetical protein